MILTVYRYPQYRYYIPYAKKDHRSWNCGSENNFNNQLDQFLYYSTTHLWDLVWLQFIKNVISVKIIFFYCLVTQLITTNTCSITAHFWKTCSSGGKIGRDSLGGSECTSTCVRYHITPLCTLDWFAVYCPLADWHCCQESQQYYTNNWKIFRPVRKRLG